ncbi:hypothetical protein BD626DRAFT_235356 [Schizophyllum amplum]|uniref:Uncharacterized protein n=1 Tax=Schizophyllum amplum TaxID=97359 RepID=A0A550CJ61_9AGAR|nr:hypothetical protein BD626DRAFT_235356 [Auriculariopsis ampla]
MVQYLPSGMVPYAHLEGATYLVPCPSQACLIPGLSGHLSVEARSPNSKRRILPESLAQEAPRKMTLKHLPSPAFAVFLAVAQYRLFFQAGAYTRVCEGSSFAKAMFDRLRSPFRCDLCTSHSSWTGQKLCFCGTQTLLHVGSGRTMNCH